MKKIIAFILCLAIGLTGCSSNNLDKGTGTTSNAESTTNLEESNIEFSGMDDDALLTYVKDKVYEETINNLDSDKYVVEEVQTTYLSKEYLEETAYNSQSNIYFGYTLEELNDFFQGDRYIFNLSDEGTTTVEKLQEVADTDSQQVIKNVAIGTGVILVCVTVSVVSAGAGAPAAVTAVFAASAKSATIFALSSGTFSAVSAGIVRGYQTGDINEALDAVALAGSEGFKWGAITGVITDGGEEAFLLKSGTKGGLTMSEVATIQKESKYPVELISKFNSMKQYEIFKSSGLTVKMIDGKTALIQKIDLDYIDDVTGKTNLQLMQEGYAPLDPTGHPYELHHIGQKRDSPLAILTQKVHRGKDNNKILHTLTDNFDNPSSKNEWGTIKKKFWKDYAKQVVNGGI